MMRAFRNVSRTLGALLFTVLASTALASASIQVNKSFSPNSVALGGVSLVTVTLQNDSTSSAATITTFSDDIGTTMAGHATLLSSPAPATTCPGGSPSIAGQVLAMNNGQIPIAPSTSAPGSCTITFSVVGALSGNGFNTIHAADVVTSLGSPGADVTQTLSVQNANVATSATGFGGSVQTGDTATVSFVLTNPATIPLTSTAFAITSSASASYTLSGYTTTCGGAATLPSSGTSGSAGFSGLTIPASGSCTVTLNVTSPSATTVTLSLAANAVTDAQGASDATGASTTAKFITGQPTVSKSFSPAAVAAGGPTTLTFNVQNTLVTKPLTNAAISDTLPTGLTITGTPTANSFCGSPTLGGSGTGTLTFSGGTIAINHICTITATVNVPSAQAAGTITNSVPAGNFTSTEATGATGAATANLVVTAAGGGMTISQSATPSSGTVNAPLKITLNFVSVGTALTGGTFADVLPQTTATMAAVTSGGIYAPTFSGCGSGSPTVTFGGTGGNTTVSGSNLAIASGGTCAVSFYVAFTAAVGSTKLDTNTLVASNVSFTGSSGAISPPTNASVTLSEVPTFSINNYVASNSGLAGQQLTVAATLYDSSGTADTSAVMVVDLTTGHVALAAVPNFTFTGCPAGFGAANITIGGSRESFTANLGSINATCSIGYDVIDEGGASGTWAPANSSYSSTLTGGTAIGSTALNSVTFATSSIDITKAFSPNQIQSGGNSTADITLTVPQAGTIARTQANGVAFSDALPANVAFSPTPNVTFTGCQQTGQSAPAFSISGTTISISNVSLVTVGATQTACDVKFDVTSSVVGAPLNQIAASTVTSTSGITNTQNALASLTVNAGLGIAKTFLNPSFAIGATDYVRLLVTNSASTTALTGGTIVDAMPSTLVLASTTLGAIQAGDPVLCGGSVAGPVGIGTLNLSGLAVAGLTGPTAPGQCVVYVQVKASGSAAPGSVSNTIAAGGLNVGGYINQAAATGSVTLTAAPNTTVSKTFAPALIAPNAASVLSIVVDNTAAGSPALSGMALIDALPTGVHIAATPNASTTCGAGTVTAVAATSTVGLTSGGVAASATCTITVSVTGTTGGTFTNTIAANALTSTQGATNAAAATANLTITSITLSKAFAPASITAGGSSTLTITIPNGATPLTGMALTDTLPAGVTIAATPTAATTCPSGVVTAVAAGTTVALAGGTLAANATCTIGVRVTGTVVASYVNTIATNALSTAQTISNQTPATATLDITAVPDVTLSKAFSPASVLQGATSLLTITVNNMATSSVPLSGLAFGDAYPAGLVNAATPAGATTCPAGSVTAVAGTGTLALSAATLAANASCTVTVTVEGPAGTYSNTVSSVTTTQGATNVGAATATLSVAAPGTPTITDAFAPPSILTGGLSTLTVTIANTGTNAIALTNMALTDALLAGVTNAPVPNAATTCLSGVAGGSAGGSTLTLGGASLAAGATCVLTVEVTSASTGAHTNTIAANALSDTQLLSNAAPANATLTVSATAAVSLTQLFAPATIVAGTTSVLTLSIANTAGGAIPLTGIALTDALPAGLVLAAIPNASTTCSSGTVAAIAGAAGFALSAATLGANASCTLSVTVTAGAAGTFSNALAAGVLTTTQGATNAATVATLSVTAVAAPPLVLTKTFAPASIVSGGASTLTVTIANQGAGAIALTALAFADALPAGVVVAAVPNAATTCGAGIAGAGAGATILTLASATLAGGAACTVSVRVTSGVPGAYVDTSAVGAVSDTQDISNALIASASLNVTTAPAIGLSQAYMPAAIPAGATSVLTVTFTNTAAGAVALTALAFTDALPAGVVLAATPNAGTTCPGGVASAVAAAATFALSGATLGVNASCTVALTVTASSAGIYINAIAAAAVSDAQHVTNLAVAATLTVSADATLHLTKSSDVAGAAVTSGQTVAYTVTIVNPGTTVVTGVKFTDVSTNGALVSGSVTVDGAAAPDAIVKAAAPLGSIAAGATVTIRYRAIVAANAAIGAQLTNNATAGSDQGCGGSACSGSALPDAVSSPAKLDVTLLIDGKLSETVTLGQVVTYTALVSNVGGSSAQQVTFSDTLPLGVTPVAGSLTTANAVRDAGARSLTSVRAGADTGIATTTSDGQTVEASLGTLAAGASSTVAFRATITLPIPTVAQNIVTIGASGIASSVTSNPVVARMVKAQLTVTKSASAVVVRIGDRVDYVVHVTLPAGIVFGKTTIVDQLPGYVLFAPGSARLDGVLGVPAISGHTLTWTLPALGAPVTLTYATSIAPGVSANATLTNLVAVSAAASGGGPAGGGSASVALAVAASTFGTCYPITGRVYDDGNNSGRYEAGDAGLPGVSIVLDDGESAVTDSYGRYNFPCVRQGMHALRLDERTLPTGSAAYPDRAIDSERSTRRLVHGIFDDTILQDINFAIGQVNSGAR